MAADRQDLDARLAAATPQDTVRGVIFNAIFRVLREHGGDAAAMACDPEKKGKRIDFFAYPVADFLRIIWDAADRLEPSAGGVEPAFHAVGAWATRLVLESVPGRTLLALAGGGGPRAFLPLVPNGYRATVSYGERTVAWSGERHATITFRRDFLVPPFHCGVLAAATEQTGGKQVRARGASRGLLEAVYDVEWE